MLLILSAITLDVDTSCAIALDAVDTIGDSSRCC